MKLLINVLIVSTLLGACGSPKKHRDEHVLPPVATNLDFVRPTDCREHIRAAVCVVNSKSLYQDTRTCQGDNSDYVLEFQKMYDTVPGYLQKMFCSVRHFYIETDIESLAYAQWVDNRGKPDGVNFGIRKSLFDQKVSMAEVLSWKEQTNFTEASAYEVKDELPRVEIKEKAAINLPLYYILVHEFGHFFDGANRISDEGCVQKSKSDESCHYTQAGTWGSLSWKTENDIKDEFALVNDTFCFYFCDVPRSIASFNELYQNFERMPFATTYATSNSMEDFAETFTFLVNQESSVFEKGYKLPDGTSINLTERFNTALLGPKREFINNFMKRPDLAYP